MNLPRPLACSRADTLRRGFRLDVDARFCPLGATTCGYCGRRNIIGVGCWPRATRVFHAVPRDIATCMYYTGLDPFTGEGVYTASHLRDRKLQRALLQFFKPENDFEVREALLRAGRADRIGAGCDALIPAQPPEGGAAGPDGEGRTIRSQSHTGRPRRDGSEGEGATDPVAPRQGLPARADDGQAAVADTLSRAHRAGRGPRPGFSIYQRALLFP
jgi:hypothetical protein